MTSPIVAGVALREDDSAPIALGRDLAALTGAPLTLVHAYPYAPVSVSPALSGLPVVAYQQARRERALTELERLAAPLRDELDVGVRAAAGASPAATLHDVAAALAAPFLVAGSTHRGRVGRVMPGSVSARLLHGSPCAVAVAPRGYAGRDIRRIGVAFADTAEGRDALSAAALLAGVCSATVHAFTAREPVRWDSALAVPGWLDPAVLARHTEERAHATAELARELVPADVLEDAEVVPGRPAEALIAASFDVDLLVCGSRGYGPLHAVVLGGVSRALVDGAACPVLVVPRAAAATLDALAPLHDAALEV